MGAVPHLKGGQTLFAGGWWCFCGDPEWAFGFADVETPPTADFQRRGFDLRFWIPAFAEMTLATRIGSPFDSVQGDTRCAEREGPACLHQKSPCPQGARAQRL